MKVCFLILSLFSVFQARAEFHIYSGLAAGSTSMSEEQAPLSYRHENQFFIGHLGFALGGGYMISGPILGFGVKAEAAWLGNSSDRKPVGTNDSIGYRNESLRLLGAVTLSLRPGPVSFDLDYYPVVSNTMSYSDGKSENPFRKNDVIKGNGIGFSIGFKFFPPLRNFISFRRFTYNQVDMSGAPLSLPTDKWSVFNIDEVLFGFGSEF